MLIAVGTNHKRSPVEIRERLAFSKKSLKKSLPSLLESKDLRAAVILSTCNRVEVYADAGNVANGICRLKELLSQRQKENSGTDKRLNAYLYALTGRDAIQHLFSVTAGLDSQVPGETEISEQVNFAYREAKSINAVNGPVEEIFTAALSAAKKVRSETNIAKGKVSIGSVAVDFIKEKVGSISGKKVLIIGVGKISGLVAKYIGKESPDIVFIANRTFKTAGELADLVAGKAVRFSEFKKELANADIVISATASPHLLIRREDLAAAAKPLLIIDLAVPRDVEPSVREIPGITLYDLNDLDAIIRKNVEKRKSETEAAREILKRETAKLWEKLSEAERTPFPDSRSIWWEPGLVTQA